MPDTQKCCKKATKCSEEKKAELNKALEEASNATIDPRTIEQSNPNENLEVNTANKSSKKRRCANCNCQNKTEKPSDCEVKEVPVVKSGCGSCALGDAFRCDGCPYKGMPAFKEGEEFKFDSNVDDL